MKAFFSLILIASLAHLASVSAAMTASSKDDGKTVRYFRDLPPGTRLIFDRPLPWWHEAPQSMFDGKILGYFEDRDTVIKSRCSPDKPCTYCSIIPDSDSDNSTLPPIAPEAGDSGRQFPKGSTLKVLSRSGASSLDVDLSIGDRHFRRHLQHITFQCFRNDGVRPEAATLADAKHALASIVSIQEPEVAIEATKAKETRTVLH